MKTTVIFNIPIKYCVANTMPANDHGINGISTACCALNDLNALRFTSGGSVPPRHALKSLNSQLAVDHPWPVLETWFWTVLCLMCLFSRDLHSSCAHLKRAPGGPGLRVGHQRELQLLPRIRALLPCHPHLCGQRDMEWRGASVPAWVLYYININQTDCFIPVGLCNPMHASISQKMHLIYLLLAWN